MLKKQIATRIVKKTGMTNLKIKRAIDCATQDEAEVALKVTPLPFNSRMVTAKRATGMHGKFLLYSMFTEPIMFVAIKELEVVEKKKRWWERWFR